MMDKGPIELMIADIKLEFMYSVVPLAVLYLPHTAMPVQIQGNQRSHSSCVILFSGLDGSERLP